jgi:hypothetical protein
MQSVIVAVIFGATATLAHADWQYTAWSMNQTQVASALAKQGTERLPPFQPIEKQDPSEPIIAFRAPYEAGGLTFDALFAFDRATDKLLSVRLVAREGASGCDTLRSGLIEKYGKWESEVDRSLPRVKQIDMTWRDAVGKNYLKLNDYTAMGTRGCSVEYKPLQATATKGL